ncbi:lipoprotein [Catenulispora yoronensis]|uniref:Lipoprotein n=1 Tax=Catenulispora yoronensis TaxID=450799 RepID=A0ABN2VBD8_9ACTN
MRIANGRRRLLAGVVPLLAAAALVAGCSSTTPVTPATPSAQSAQSAPTSPVSEPASASDTDALLVADFGGTTVTFVDPARGATGTVEVGTAPYGVAVGPDGRAWVATAEAVAVVDTRERKLLARIPYGVDTGRATYGEYRGGGMGIAITPDGSRVFVGVNVPGADGVLVAIDARTNAIVGQAATGRRPFDVVMARDGAEAYAVDHDSYDVTAVRTTDLAARRMTVAPYGTAGGLGGWLKPHYAEVRADGRLLLPFEGERLAVLDPATGGVRVEPMTAGTHQHGTALAADGRLLVVGTGSDGTVDGPASLTVRGPDGQEQVYKLDGAHEDVAVSHDGQTAYVSGGFTRDGYWNGITVVDLGTGATQRLDVGERPLGIVVLG